MANGCAARARSPTSSSPAASAWPATWPPFPFTNRASAHQKAEIESLLRERIAKLELDPQLDYLNVPGLSPLDRQFLVERQLISRELANAEGPRGVALGPSETVSLMVNEEDHLRLQVMRSGFALDEAWQDIDRVDDLLEQQRQLRLQRGVRLPDRLPDQRRHRHARQRHAAPAGPGADQADREGLPRPAEDQPGRARPVRRRQPGLGRLLPDLQPGHARQERDDHPQRDPRGHPADHHLRTPGPHDPDAREPAGPAGPRRRAPSAPSARPR